MSLNILPGLLDSFKNYTVLIIGDVMVDSYIWGKVTRISPEAPVPIISQTKQEIRMGGAANVAKNVSSLGANTILCSVIGDDVNGRIFKNMVVGEEISVEGIIESNNRITTVKTRVISQGQQLLRVDNEIDNYLDKKSEALFQEKVKNILDKRHVDAVIFQDYDKGVITPDIIHNITDFCKKKQIPVLVDPKKRNFNLYKGSTLFKPNFKEFTEGLNLSVQKDDFKSIYNASKILHTDYNHDLVMITLSESGIIISDNTNYHVIQADVRDVADVSGAGDTVIAMASLCLAAKLDPKHTALFSNMAGGLVCEKVGVIPITGKMLLAELSNRI